MGKPRNIVAAGLLMAGCKPHPMMPPAAYALPQDHLVALFPRLQWFMPMRCAGATVPIGSCYTTRSAQRFRGLWYRGASRFDFYPGADRPTFALLAERGIELVPAQSLTWEWNHSYEHELVLIDFIGRRTRYAAPGGKGTIVIDRILSERVIERE